MTYAQMELLFKPEKYRPNIANLLWGDKNRPVLFLEICERERLELEKSTLVLKMKHTEEVKVNILYYLPLIGIYFQSRENYFGIATFVQCAWVGLSVGLLGVFVIELLRWMQKEKGGNMKEYKEAHHSNGMMKKGGKYNG